MKCPQCETENKRSIVYVGSSSVTCLMYQSFYDEDGVYHFHDPNNMSTNYTCSEGHNWVDYQKTKCWCGWPDATRN